MGIHKRGKYWYAQFQINGRTYIQSTKTTNKNQAREFERRWRNEVYNKEYLGDKDPITLHEALENFQRTKEDTKNIRNIISNVRTVKSYFDENLQFHQVTSAEIERFVQKRRDEGFKPQTILHSIHVLRGAWKHAKKLGYRVVDVEWPVIKRDKGRLRYLSVEEERRLLNELDPKRVYGPNHQQDPRFLTIEKRQARQDNYDLVVALLDTGARYGEIASLEWSQVNLEDRTLQLWRSKTDNESILFMTDRLYAALLRRSQLKCSEKYVFTNKKGGPRNHATVAIRKAMQRAGLHDVRIHDLRHTAASRLVQNGLSLQEVSKILIRPDFSRHFLW